MKKFLSLIFALMMICEMSSNALEARAYSATNSIIKENIIKSELSDMSLTDEAKKFLYDNGVDFDHELTQKSSGIKSGKNVSEYVGILNEEILALKRAAQAHGFTRQQIQEYVDGIVHAPTEVILENSNKAYSTLSTPTSTRIPDYGIGYEVQSLYGYNQATSYVTLPTRNINNLNDITYLFYTAYSSNNCMDFGVRGGMYNWVSSFTPVQNSNDDAVAIGKSDGERVYFNISVETNGWLRCKIIDANNFSNVILNVLYQMSGVTQNGMFFNKQITLCNNFATYTSGSSITHGKFDQSYLYTTTGYSIMNSSNTNPNRRGAFGGSGVIVHSYTQWGSEDVSIYFN